MIATATSVESEQETRIVIGNTTKCIDSSCTGWLVDSFIGKYWIQCLDSKHSMINGEKEVGNHPHYQTHHRIQEPPQPGQSHSTKEDLEYDR